MLKHSFSQLQFPAIKVVFLSVSMLLMGKYSFCQTTLISPTGDGGFETGTSFADNGWTVSNSSNNPWIVGALSSGLINGNAAFISSNGTSPSYGTTSNSSNYFWRDITVPAGESVLSLSFNWIANGESTWDLWQVFVAPTTISPNGSTTYPGSGATNVPANISGATWVANGNLQTAVQTANIILPSSLAGATFRLIFHWKNDGSGGSQAPAQIDNISLISYPAMSGIYTIDNNIAESATNFNTFSSAIQAINTRGISSSVTFNVIAGQTFNENLPALTATGTASNTITFQKSGVGNNPKIVPTGTATGASATDFGICISGGDYITFDGIDVDGSAATTTTNAIEFGYLIRNASATNGAQYNTIKNCSVTLNKNYISAAANACIFSSVSSTQGGVTPTNATGANSYNKYYNLTLSNAQNGIYAVGNTTYPDLSCEFGVEGIGCQTILNSISNLGGIFSGVSYGIYAQYQNSAKIFNFDISNIRAKSNISSGIYILNFSGTNEIFYNIVSNISNSGTTTGTSLAAGIQIQNSSGTATARVYNNFIYDIKSSYNSTASSTIMAYGIYCNVSTSSTTSEIDNNNIYLSVASATYSAACFGIGSTTGIHKVRGNIFFNAFPNQTPNAYHTAFYSASATSIGGVGSVSNYNDLYVTGTNGYVGRGSTTNYTALSDWQARTGTPDANSISIDPTFTSSTDLHVSAAGLSGISGFTPQLWVTTDIDCDPQGPTYRIGADAPAGSACTTPANQATSLQLTSVTSSSLQGSFTAAASSPSGYLVVRSTSNSLSSDPVNTTSYSAGNALGGGVVVQSSASTTFSESSLTDNTTYYYFIFSYNNSGCSGGPLYNVTTPLTGFTVTCLATPSTPTFSGITSSEMTVNWGAITGATSYNLEVSTNSGFTAPISGSPFSVAGTSQTINSLTSGNIYYVRVTAVGANCNSAVSSSANTTLTCATPSAQPTSLSFSSATTTSITGSFTASSPAPSGYLVVRSTSSSLSANPINGTSYSSGNSLGGGTVVGTPGTSTSISATGLTVGTQYYFFVFAYNNTMCSGGPIYNTASPLSASYWTCPSAPTTPTLSGITSSGMTVNWGAVTGATSYNLEVSTNSGFTAPISGSTFSVSGTSQPLTGLTSGNTYYVRVTAVGANCNSALSATANTTLTCATPSAQPTSLSFSAATTTSITGSFTAASPAPSGYLVVRSTSSSLSANPINGTSYSSGNSLGGGTVVGTPGTSTSISATGLSAGTQYYFFVFAYNNTTCSGGPVYNTTSPLSGSYWTCPSAPSTPTFSGITSSGMTVNWGAVTGAASYNLEVSTNSGFTAPISGSTFSVLGTSQPLTGLTSGNTYYVRVTAVGANCNSALSATANTTLTCAAPSAQATSLSFSAATTTSITGSFTAASPAPSGYLVVRSTSSSLSANPINGTSYSSGNSLGGGTVVGTPGTSTSISATGLTVGTQYYFFVFAYNNTTCSGGPIYNTTSPLSASYWTCPSAPTTPTFSGITSSGMTVNWGAVTGATSYSLEVSTNSGFSAPISGSPFSDSGTSQSLIGLTSGNTYYVRVTAVGANCNSAASTSANTLLSCELPTSLSNGISINSTEETTVSGSFSAATISPTGYLVIRTSTNSMPTPVNGITYTVGSNALGYIEYVSTTAGSWTSTSLTPGTAYYYWIFSYNSGSCTGPVYSSSATSASATTNSCSTFNSTIFINGNNTVSGVSYPTISAAILALNACGGITQPTIFELTSGYVNELTNNTLSLPSIAGMSGTNTITIRPASGVNNLEITSSVAGATIAIDGGDYWVIDGRPGGSSSLNSSNLAITNTSTATSGIAIQITNDAVGNVVRYSNLKASFGASTSGVVVLSGGTTNVTGNDNNTIEFNNINANGSAFNGIYCAGAAIVNDNAVIQNNNIYDFFNAGNATNGINISANNTSFTLSNNAIYQTVTRTYTTGATHSGILINNTSGINFSVNGNQIGGGFSVTGGPTPSNKYTIAGTIANRYKAINLAVGTTTATSVQSNTISGFDFTSTSASTTNGGPWCGIYISAGKVNIGNSSGNIIGSSTGNSSILLNLQTNSGGVSSGVYIEAISSDFNISNNSIGSITTTGSTTSNAHGFTGIATLATGTVTVSNNVIGSASTSNSISASNAATTTSSFQYLNGILNTGNSTVLNISNNTIANLNNAYVPSAFQSNINSIMCGISSTAGAASIMGNTIRNLTANANATNTGVKASVVGLSITSNAGATISQNVIHSLNSSNTAGTTISVTGIAYSGATSGTNLIERNRIYNLNNTSPTSGRVYGIFIVAGNANVNNNMIRLGYDVSGSSITTPISIYGIFEAGGTNNYYHNSMYVGGSNVTSNTTIPSTAAFYCSSATGTRSILNNIFVNTRSNSAATNGPKNYSIYLPSSVTGLTCNYNIFQASGTGSVFGAISGGDRVDFTAWKASSSAPDANSINADPLFVDPTNATSPDLHINQSLNSPADQAGTNVAAVTTDFDGQTRSDFTAVDIGADAFIKTPTIQLSGTPSALTTCLGIASSTTSYTLNGYGLTGDVTFSGGDYLEVSTSGSGPFNSSVSVTPINGSITNQTIYTRIKINSLVGNGVSAQISHSSTGATSVSQSVSVTINQPSTTVSVSGVTINDGDYLWNGNTSSDGSNANNWFVLNNGNYELAINAPSSSDKVFIVPYSIESACISQTNSPNNPSVGSFSSKDFYIGSGASLTLGDNVTFNVSGDFINNGTFNSGSGTVSMNGTSAQTIGGSSNTVFNNLTIDNSSGASLTNSISVNGTLNLSSGKLNLNEHMLTIGTNSSDGLITGASSINYIVAYKNGVNMGKLIRHINSNTSYSFPIGDLSKYTPLTFSLNSGDLTNATLQVYTIAEKVTGLNPDVSCYINRSWSVEPTGITNPNYNISYSFGIGDFTGDENISLSPIKLSNGIWYKPSNSSLSSGTAQGSENATIFSDNQVPAVETTGTLTWNSLTSFSEFGGAGGNQPLPVELISFNGNCSGEEIILNWNTASEHNSSYFDVEESRDGVSWNVLSSLPAAGNSTSLLNYSLTDKFITSSNNYYRLKQVDIDGTFKIHSPINVSCNEINSKLFLSYPNPSSNSFNVVINDDKMVGNSHLSVFDVTGKNVFQKLIEINNGINMFMIDEKLVPGIYFIKINNGIKSTETIRHIAN